MWHGASFHKGYRISFPVLISCCSANSRHWFSCQKVLLEKKMHFFVTWFPLFIWTWNQLRSVTRNCPSWLHDPPSTTPTPATNNRKWKIMAIMTSPIINMQCGLRFWILNFRRLAQIGSMSVGSKCSAMSSLFLSKRTRNKLKMRKLCSKHIQLESWSCTIGRIFFSLQWWKLWRRTYIRRWANPSTMV